MPMASPATNAAPTHQYSRRADDTRSGPREGSVGRALSLYAVIASPCEIIAKSRPGTSLSGLIAESQNSGHVIDNAVTSVARDTEKPSPIATHIAGRTTSPPQMTLQRRRLATAVSISPASGS